MSKVKPIPEGMHSLTPHLVCRDAHAAIDFFDRALAPSSSSACPAPTARSCTA